MVYFDSVILIRQVKIQQKAINIETKWNIHIYSTWQSDPRLFKQNMKDNRAVKQCVSLPQFSLVTLQTARHDHVRSITSHTNKYCTYTVLRYIWRYFSGCDMDAVLFMNYSLTTVFQVDDFWKLTRSGHRKFSVSHELWVYLWPGCHISCVNCQKPLGSRDSDVLQRRTVLRFERAH